MALSDCPKCWDTPCTCGHEYKSWDASKLEAHIAMLQKVLKAKHGEQAMSASFSFGRALCGHLKANGRLHIQDLNAIKEQAKEDLLILDKLIEDKLEVGFDNERDCYTIKKDGQEIATANMREYAINELFKA